jgi:hypothetical protein
MIHPRNRYRAREKARPILPEKEIIEDGLYTGKRGLSRSGSAKNRKHGFSNCLLRYSLYHDA